MKKLLYILLFAPLVLFGQEQDPCYSVNDYKVLLEESNPSISFQLSVGWNMVGYTGTAENSGIVSQINGALSNDATAENTFQVIKNVSGQFWSAAFAQISSFTQGEGYMMYVISETGPSLSFLNSVNLPEVLGCMDCTSEFYNPWATQADGSCGYSNQGCTDESYLEYNELATEDNGSCLTLVYLGCTYPLAINYNESANTEDGSCTYFISEEQAGGGDCVLPNQYEGGNTASNMTLLLNDSFISSISLNTNNPYIVALTESNLVVGSASLAEEDLSNGMQSVAIWGDDAITEPIDGALPGETISLQIVDGANLYIVNSTPIIFTVDGMSLITSGSMSYDCTHIVLACPYDAYLEYSSTAIEYDVSECLTLIVEGCTSEMYVEYNSAANREDGSCLTLIIEGCIDNAYAEYNPEANTDDGTCSALIILGCNNPLADNYNIQANTNDGTCIIYGCMDNLAVNYNAESNIDDDCIYYGCINSTADNYNINANTNDGTCIIYGCTLVAFPNYNSQATTDDFSCDMESTDIYGCTDSLFGTYYNPLATINNDACENIVAIGDQLEGGIVFYIDETGQHGLVAAIEDLEGTYEWGCYETSLSGADGQAIGTGYQNTLDIVAGCSDVNIAAFNALNSTTEGYTDWYLPSKDELLEMYSTIGNGSPEGDIGGFVYYYWSSSENDNYSAWQVNFYNGDSNSSPKPNNYRVRVIRAF